MSIVTKTGDGGQTALMYNRRVSKCHPRVEAYGTVDELNAALGLARAATSMESVRERIWGIQKDLVQLMGELATSVEDLPRFAKDGFQPMHQEMTARLDVAVEEIESRGVSYRGWATPGNSVSSAYCDLARTICRRAERHVCALQEAGQLQNDEIITYLNRLSDLLWLFARVTESETGAATTAALR